MAPKLGHPCGDLDFSGQPNISPGIKNCSTFVGEYNNSSASLIQLQQVPSSKAPHQLMQQQQIQQLQTPPQ